MLTPPWLTWARGEIGVREIAGPNHEARIVRYWSLGEVPLDVNDDETPWCAAFACAALEQVGIRSPRTPRARGFSSGATLVPCDQRLGAIIVLSSDRGAASGHVGFLTGVGDRRVILLGGNQGNRVCEAPFDAARIVATVWPAQGGDFRRYPMAPRASAAGATVSDR